MNEHRKGRVSPLLDQDYDLVAPHLAFDLEDPRSNEREAELVSHLVHVAWRAGVRADRVSIISFYVALKSQPVSILVGPPNTGKLALVQALTASLSDADSSRCQVMVGHAWWAAGSENVALFTEAQWRFNIAKILSLMEEAGEPGNTRRPYFACMLRVSPAELRGLFAPLAIQLRRSRVVCLPFPGLSGPVFFPENLRLVGTMDTTADGSVHFGLGPSLVLLHSLARDSWDPPGSSPFGLSLGREFEFPKACPRDEHSAYLKLRRIIGGGMQPLGSLFRVCAILRRSAVHVSRWEFGQAMIHLANTWSECGIGLFEAEVHKNAEIALDVVIERFLVAHTVDIRPKFSALRHDLMSVLDGRFPRSAGAFSRIPRWVPSV